MEEKQGRRRRAFSEEYKAEVVELCRSGGRRIGQVARDLELTETAVRRWVAQAEVDRGERDGLTTAEREQLRLTASRPRRLLLTDPLRLSVSTGWKRRGRPHKRVGGALVNYAGDDLKLTSSPYHPTTPSSFRPTIPVCCGISTPPNNAV